MSKVKITKYIEEHARGRRKKADGTGWEKRIGSHVVPGASGKRGRGVTISDWEDCDPPLKVTYDQKEAAGITGGTVTSTIEVIGGARPTLSQDEVRLIVAYLLHVANSTFTSFNGNPPTEGQIREGLAATAILKKLGVKEAEIT